MELPHPVGLLLLLFGGSSWDMCLSLPAKDKAPNGMMDPSFQRNPDGSLRDDYDPDITYWSKNVAPKDNPWLLREIGDPSYGVYVLDGVASADQELKVWFTAPAAHHVKDWIGIYKAGDCKAVPWQTCFLSRAEIHHKDLKLGEVILPRTPMLAAAVAGGQRKFEARIFSEAAWEMESSVVFEMGAGAAPNTAVHKSPAIQALQAAMPQQLQQLLTPPTDGTSGAGDGTTKTLKENPTQPNAPKALLTLVEVPAPSLAVPPIGSETQAAVANLKSWNNWIKVKGAKKSDSSADVPAEAYNDKIVAAAMQTAMMSN